MAVPKDKDAKTEKPATEGDGQVMGYPAEYWENDVPDLGIDPAKRYRAADREKMDRQLDADRKVIEDIRRRRGES